MKREKHTKIFNYLCEIIIDKQLMDIAKADYGFEADEAFAELKEIQQTQLLPKEIPYIVKEVLSLTRYGEDLNTVEEQQTKIFNNVIILLGRYNEEYDQLDNGMVKLKTQMIYMKTYTDVLFYSTK